jgi:hypothetical protein
MHNIYLPKHAFFGPQQARVRACLAAIDHNFNVNCPAKKDSDGDAKYTYKFTRDGMTYTAIPVKVPKITTWRTDIMNEVVEAVRCSAVPRLQIPTDDHLKLYGKRRNPKPDMAELVAATKARSRYRVQSKKWMFAVQPVITWLRRTLPPAFIDLVSWRHCHTLPPVEFWPLPGRGPGTQSPRCRTRTPAAYSTPRPGP